MYDNNKTYLISWYDSYFKREFKTDMRGFNLSYAIRELNHPHIQILEIKEIPQR